MVKIRRVGFAGLFSLLAGVALAAEPLATSTAVWLPPGAVARLGTTRLRHAAPLTVAVFSPDGKTLVSGGQDGFLRAWDVATGEQKASFVQSNTAVTFIRYIQSGTRIAVQFSTGTLRHLDPDTLREVATTDVFNMAVQDVAADGRFVAGIGTSGLTVIETATGLPKLEIPGARIAVFHPDGKHVLVADGAGTVTVYQLTGGKPTMTVKHGSPLNGLVLRADGKVFATGGTGSDGGVKLWEIGREEPILEIADSAGRIQFLPNDCIAAVKGLGHGIYDIRKRTWSNTFAEATGLLTVSTDGKYLAATGRDSVRVRIWDLATHQQLHATNDSLPDTAFLAPSADGQELFIITADQAFNWRLTERAPRPAGTFPGTVMTAERSGHRLAVSTPEGLAIWDPVHPAQALAKKPTRLVDKADGNIKVFALSPDGKRIAFATKDKQLWLADADTGKALRSLPIPLNPLALEFTPDGEKLAILAQDGFLRLWEVPTKTNTDRELFMQRVPQIRSFHRGTLAISPDGNRIAASASRRLSIIDVEAKRELFGIDHLQDDTIYTTAQFSPDGRLVLVGSGGLTGTVEVWELATRTLVRRFSTGMGSINRLAIFPDGTRFASAGSDDAVTVWDLTFRLGKAPPTTTELRVAWVQLANLDAATGYPAIKTLSAGGTNALPLIRAGLDEYIQIQAAIQKLIKDLGSDVITTRDQAMQILPGYGILALPALIEAVESNDSAEVRKRATTLVENLAARQIRIPAHGLAPDQARLIRAVAVLETLNTPEALDLLQRITTTRGPAAKQAEAGLQRLKQPKPSSTK